MKFFLSILAVCTLHGAATAGSPQVPSPEAAPGGFIFQGDPDSVTVHRDTLHVLTVRPDDEERWIPLGDGDVLVMCEDPTDVWKLPYRTYSYFVDGHWGKTQHSPYSQKTKVRQPEATLITSRAQICLQRIDYNKCQERKR